MAHSPCSSLLLLPLLGLGCTRGGTDPSVPAIAGRWAYTESITDDLFHISCADTGTYEFTQVGSAFDGTFAQVGTCRSPSGPLDNHGRGPVADGRIVGLTVRFHAAACCEYEGQLSGDPPSGLGGRGFWDLELGGTMHHFTGTWEARR